MTKPNRATPGGRNRRILANGRSSGWTVRRTARICPWTGGVCPRPGGQLRPSLDTSQAEGMTGTIVDAPRPVTGGVDTHLDVNVAAALDPVGGLLAVAEFPATAAGHRQLLSWLAGFGPVAGSAWRAPAPTARDWAAICGRLVLRWSRSTALTGRPGAGPVSPTRWMPSRRPGRHCRAGPAARPR